MGIIPAITGKVELVYEGEQEGVRIVAQDLIGDAIRTFFPLIFLKLKNWKNKIKEQHILIFWIGFLSKAVLNY